jgi:hypothetical protein
MVYHINEMLFTALTRKRFSAWELILSSQFYSRGLNDSLNKISMQ